MARCCGSAGTCACRIDAGRNIDVQGSGTSQDPYVIASDVYLAVEDSEVFDMGLTGSGTLASPWVVTVRYRSEVGIAGLPDVSEIAPTTGQVLGWDGSTWKPVAPTTAAAGSVLTDASLAGSGSVGAPLQVRENAARYLETTAAGLGVTDGLIQRIVNIYPDATTRTNAGAPAIHSTLSMLQNKPGRIDWWDGTAWKPITNGISLAVQTGQLLALSGNYVAGTPITEYVAQVAATADASGEFDVISTSALGGYAGVLSVDFQPTGGTPMVVMPRADTNRIRGKAFRVTDGTAFNGATITGTVRALLY